MIFSRKPPILDPRRILVDSINEEIEKDRPKLLKAKRAELKTLKGEQKDDSTRRNISRAKAT